MCRLRGRSLFCLSVQLQSSAHEDEKETRQGLHLGQGDLWNYYRPSPRLLLLQASGMIQNLDCNVVRWIGCSTCARCGHTGKSYSRSKVCSGLHTKLNRSATSHRENIVWCSRSDCRRPTRSNVVKFKVRSRAIVRVVDSNLIDVQSTADDFLYCACDRRVFNAKTRCA